MVTLKVLIHPKYLEVKTTLFNIIKFTHYRYYLNDSNFLAFHQRTTLHESRLFENDRERLLNSEVFEQSHCY